MLYDIECTILALNLVQRWYRSGWGYFEAGRVPHTDYVYFEALSNGNTLMKVDPN